MVQVLTLPNRKTFCSLMKISHLLKRNITSRYLSTRCGPIPFPDSYNIGIDIAKISRFNDIIVRSQFSNYKEPDLPVVHTAERPFQLRYGQEDPEPLGLLEAFIRKTFNYVEWGTVRSRLVLHLNDSPGSLKLATFLASRYVVFFLFSLHSNVLFS